MSYKIKTQPASEPVSLADAKLHLRVDDTTEDTLITSIIVAARQFTEKYLNRSLITQTWNLYLDALPSEIQVMYGDIQSFTSVKYYDSDNAEQTLSDALYDEDLISNPARITRTTDQTYPEVFVRTNAINIEYIAGYGDAVNVPDSIKSAMLLIIGHLYENRQNVIIGHAAVVLPKGAEYLLDQYRIFTYANW